MHLHDLPTPALLVDIDLLDSNLRLMAERVANAGKALRPHAKAHKCVAIAKRQIDLGASGVCAATVAEAELMAHAGVESILLTSPIADSRKCDRIAALSPRVSVVVDHVQQVRWYAEAATNAGIVLNVLIDIDVNDHRTGVAPLEPALQLVREIVSQNSLRFGGLQAYSVRASHIAQDAERADYTNTVLEPVQRTREMIERSGIPVPVVTGASTGSYAADCASPYLTEIQAGSYPLMDEAYRRIGVPFANAMTILATVVSANHSDRVTLDAGFKAFSTDRTFGPEVLGESDTRYEWGGDEFGYLFPPAGRKIGDRVRLIPPHCDPTVNLYDRIWVHRGDVVIDSWPVMNRSTAGIP